MNKESYVLRLEDSVLKYYSKFEFGDDVEEIFDFKLQNREKRKTKMILHGLIILILSWLLLRGIIILSL
jgi:hypothetical protein